MRDFTLRLYYDLAAALSRRYEIIPFRDYLEHSPSGPIAILRHDVDRRCDNAVACAQVLADLGLRGTFFFRHPFTFSVAHLRRVHELGHEVGYHYEVLSKARGDHRRAFQMFRQELEDFRKHVPVETACMHGAPLSRWNNLDFWKHAAPGDFSLRGEPYLSLDFDRILYLTDTGRSWNHASASLRDRVATAYRGNIRSTPELIAAVGNDRFPVQMMLNFHPERWEDAVVPWLLQLIGQHIKNPAKRALSFWRSPQRVARVHTQQG